MPEDLGGVRDPADMPPLQRATVWTGVVIQLILLASVLWQVGVALSSL
jgi:hypothetical protein